MDVTEDFICFRCKHIRPLSGGCAAFPEGIPFGMGVNFKHSKPLPGQKNNIIFSEK